MIGFMVGAALLVVCTLLLLLRPWRRTHADTSASARDVNAGIYRDQLADLDRDLAAGTLAEADHAQARADLQRRLLDDTSAGDTSSSAAPTSRTTALLIALAMPVLAGSLYAWLGQPAALDERARQGVSQGEVDKMVAGLAARLAAKPDDPKGWAVLGRSYRVMGRMQDAANAFQRVGPELERDPSLLAEYADVLGAVANGNLEGKPLELVGQALKIDPDNGLALALAAAAAFNRKDMVQAALHWERLLKVLPPDSDDAKWVTGQLEQIRGAPGAAPRAPVAAAPAASTAATDNGATIRGRVSLAPALAKQVLPTDTVFVFARAAEGPRMPLAVQRARVSDLPLDFKLDDSLAVSPGFKLSGATEVRIEARISRSGSATPAPGDLIGVGPVVKPGARELAIQIDQTRP